MCEKNIIKKRLFLLSFLILVVFSLLILRLFYIQIIRGKEYRIAADNQKIKSIRIYPPRGIIYDRNLIPLTNRERIPTIFIFKELVEINDNIINYIKKISGLEIETIKKLIDNSQDIIEIPALNSKGNENREIKGIIITEKVERYDSKNLLAHVIGYTKRSENKGQSGIEKAYDDILKMNNELGTIMVTLDGLKRIIPGIGYKPVTNGNSTLTNSVKLTIDYHIQRLAEAIMDEKKQNGAVIVADVETGDILAMVSRPNIDLNNPTKNINSDKNDFLNKAIQHPYPPGSLFKIVVLLTALQENEISLNEKFICNGYEEVGNTIIRCHSYDTNGHGELDINKAFYESCNSVFIQLGKRVGGGKIIDTARKLGFGQKENIGLKEEKEGNLPTGNELLGPAIGNISIGQGSIEATPLQITSMMVTIANGGYKKDMTIVDGIVTENGVMVKKYRREKDIRVIPQEYNIILREYLEDVIAKGTARKISLDKIGGGGGKTGTAQAVLNGRETIAGWFSGYFPKKSPRYVITVVIEDAISGGESAAPIFEKIAKGIVLMGK
jgi:peptidoglycan glycosyltransferase/penicillin-binding protein 2